MKMDDAERRLAEELEASRDDDAAWGDAEEIQVARPTSTVVSVRMPLEEFERLSAEAQEAGESVSAFVREAITEKVLGVRLPGLVERISVMSGISNGIVSFGWAGGLQVGSRNDAPDAPPEFAALTEQRAS